MNERGDDPSVSRGLAAVVDSGTHTLILGSLPSRLSIERQEYYGNPQNAFWRIMGEVVGANSEWPYAERIERLLDSGIGLWDVLASSVRPGSLDADIVMSSARVNDFGELLSRYAGVRRVCFNGRKAAEIFERSVTLDVDRRGQPLEFHALPSTSPAHAAMRFDEKLERWRQALQLAQQS